MLAEDFSFAPECSCFKRFDYYDLFPPIEDMDSMFDMDYFGYKDTDEDEEDISDDLSYFDGGIKKGR